MASSVRFSIRGLMVITLAVAVVCAVITTALRGLEPDLRPQAVMYVTLLGFFFAATLGGSWFKRRWIERRAGPLLSHTQIGGKRRRWANVILAIFLSAATAYGSVFMATIDLGVPEFTPGLAGMTVFALTLAYGIEAGTLYLHWSWDTGAFVTEAFQNGLVVRGLRFYPWSDLKSYEPSPRKSTVVRLKVRFGVRRLRIRVAAKDRADWERIFSEKGVPLTNSLLKSANISSVEPIK